MVGLKQWNLKKNDESRCEDDWRRRRRRREKEDKGEENRTVTNNKKYPSKIIKTFFSLNILIRIISLNI